MLKKIIPLKIKGYFKLESEDRYEDEILHTIIAQNLKNQKKFSIFSALWNILMSVYLSIGYFNNLWDDFPNYKYLFIIHIAFTIYFSAHLLILHYRNKKTFLKNNTFDKFINASFIFIFLQWVAISSNFSNYEIANFALGLFLIAFIFRIKFKIIFIFSTCSYITLILGSFILNKSFSYNEESIIMGLAVIMTSLLISSMSFYYYKRDFITRRLLHNKSSQLECLNLMLEEKVDERTKKLRESNSRLIDEINIRHKLELQAYKSELDKKEAEQKLLEIQKFDKLREDFFANISHELRTPITMIYSSVQMFDLIIKNGNSVDNKDKFSKYLTSMRQNCFRLIKLVNNLIDITKIDSGFLTATLKNNDIVDLIHSLTLHTTHYIENFGINLNFTSSMHKKVIACDAELIERILLNLLSNAVKYTKSSGQINVRIDQCNGYVSISVKDTGEGIPKDRIDSIFERFVQVEESTKKQEGSGIGLSLVKSIVKMHNGKITVKSELSIGTEFIIELPDITLKTSDENSASFKSDENKDQIINIEFSDLYSK